MADTPRLSVRREYPDQGSPPSEVSFRALALLRHLYSHEAHEWFIDMLREHEEFEVATDRADEWPVPFWSETVRRVVVE